MNAQKYSALKIEIEDMIQFLQDRGVKVGEVREYVSAHVDLPSHWVKIFSFFNDLKKSTTNEALIKNVHKELKSKVISLFLYNNKLVKIIDINEQDFDKLLKYYRDTFNEKFEDYDISDLISKTDQSVSCKFNFDVNKEAFIVKNIVNDLVKIDIDDRVDKDLQQEFTNIIGLKKVAFPALYSYIFDTKNKSIILSVDLANIVKSRLVNLEMNHFSINLKKAVSGTTFPPNSRNIFNKIDSFYKNNEGFAKNLSLKTPDGVIYHAQANTQYPDARVSEYHVNGALSVKGKVSIYRIQKGFDTTTKTQYLIDLKSIAAMTTKPDPVLYEATILASNAKDFVEALGKLL